MMDFSKSKNVSWNWGKNWSRNRAGLHEDTSKEEVPQEAFVEEPNSRGWIKAHLNYFTDYYILN